jgi:hypothetical protein
MTPADPLSRARLAWRRAAIGLLFATATVFIGVSAVQIIPAVFGAGAKPLAPDSATGRECAKGLRDLEHALDRATEQAMVGGAAAGAHAAGSTNDDQEAALSAFRDRLRPEWDTQAAIADKCKASPHGAEAFAALARLRRADEGLVRRQAVEVLPLRRDVAAYLPR